MARIAGVELPNAKRIEVALTYIYGIGPTTAVEILKKTNVNPDIRVKDLTMDDERKLRDLIEKEFKVEGDLRTETAMNIKRLQDINCYRGLRHRKKLPVRGQRTHTNARTHKGPRKSVGVKKKKAE